MLLGKVEYSSRELVSINQRSVSDRCSACSVASIAAMVARVQLRAVLLREMRGESGRASGRKAGGARGEACAERLTPGAAVRCELVPTRRVDLELAECLEGGAAVGHGRCAHRPTMWHP